MGVLESKCPTCRRSMTVVYDDRTLETLLVDRTCRCPSVKVPRLVTDGM